MAWDVVPVAGCGGCGCGGVPGGHGRRLAVSGGAVAVSHGFPCLETPRRSAAAPWLSVPVRLAGADGPRLSLALVQMIGRRSAALPAPDGKNAVNAF